MRFPFPFLSLHTNPKVPNVRTAMMQLLLRSEDAFETWTLDNGPCWTQKIYEAAVETR